MARATRCILAANRKDEGIYYTPATITTPMAESMVASLFGPLMDEILAAIDKNTGNFQKARSLMTQLSRLHIVDTASGSGSFLIKVLRAVWTQYQRIAAGLEWLNKINLSGDLFDLPTIVRDAAQFREDSLFLPGQRRLLVAAILLRHISAWVQTPTHALVAKASVFRALVKLNPTDYHFRLLNDKVGVVFPDLRRTITSKQAAVEPSTQFASIR